MCDMWKLEYLKFLLKSLSSQASDTIFRSDLQTHLQIEFFRIMGIKDKIFEPESLTLIVLRSFYLVSVFLFMLLILSGRAIWFVVWVKNGNLVGGQECGSRVRYRVRQAGRQSLLRFLYHPGLVNFALSLSLFYPSNPFHKYLYRISGQFLMPECNTSV